MSFSRMRRFLNRTLGWPHWHTIEFYWGGAYRRRRGRARCLTCGAEWRGPFADRAWDKPPYSQGLFTHK